ncbi:uncharacterized protein BJ171DRAFT_584224 [Polychytrium aggregatum]|uniref:uncharacterized protein n=1 Tax=Polychytrium aggregatum TaxID=110093 RepID=UPI0022FED688|nr:uncharacterized protein BJ171DRAFT_584224 [Polychytrium aggregatum]KAI9202318.1 hypothetical protein BJ171DRAFT_584224 [Polychytrium aggregatum]
MASSTTTGDSRTEDPASQALVTTTPDLDGLVPDSPAPATWMQAWDSTYQTYYWHNPALGQSTWTNPSAPSPSSTAAVALTASTDQRSDPAVYPHVDDNAAEPAVEPSSAWYFHSQDADGTDDTATDTYTGHAAYNPYTTGEAYASYDEYYAQAHYDPEGHLAHPQVAQDSDNTFDALLDKIDRNARQLDVALGVTHSPRADESVRMDATTVASASGSADESGDVDGAAPWTIPVEPTASVDPAWLYPTQASSYGQQAEAKAEAAYSSGWWPASSYETLSHDGGQGNASQQNYSADYHHPNAKGLRQLGHYFDHEQYQLEQTLKHQLEGSDSDAQKKQRRLSRKEVLDFKEQRKMRKLQALRKKYAD